MVNPGRTTAITIDLVNASITTLADKPIIECTKDVDVNVGFYGEYSAILAKNGANGENGKTLSRNGGAGANGSYGIHIAGNLTITVATTSQSGIAGGNGGNGGKGLDASIIDGLFSNGGKGGKGGNGGYAIYANQITVKLTNGCTQDSLQLIGGNAGIGGKGGSGFAGGNNGSNGSDGVSSYATNTPVTYK